MRSIDFFVCLVAAHFSDGVFEHDILFEEMIDGDFSFFVVVHRTLQEEREETLRAKATFACSEVCQQDKVKHERSGENGVATEEINLDLHRIAHPAKDVDVVPALLVVATRRIVVDSYFVVIVGI